MTKALQIVNDKTGAIVVNGKFAITAVGLRVLSNPSFEDWQEFGRGLQKLECATQWTVGDWLNYGEHKWGEKYAQAIEKTGAGYQALAHYKWVSAQIEFCTRVQNLSWTHHREVASNDYTDDQRAELLAVAERDELSVDKFKKYLAEQKKTARLAALPDAPIGGGLELDSIRVCDISNVQLPDESIDMIFTDPPYHDEYLECYNKLAVLALQVLKPGGMLFTYCGKMFLPQIHIALSGLEYVWEFAVFQPFSKSKINKHKLFENWRPVLCYRKPGKTETREWVQDVVRGTRQKDAHEWQQDEDAPRQYIAAYTLPGQVVLDPFVGGGTTPKVCKELKRHYVCFDIDPDAVKVSIDRVSK